MAERDLSYEDLLRILQLVESSSQFSEFHLKYGDIQIDLRKHSAGSIHLDSAQGGEPAMAPTVAPPPRFGIAPSPVAAAPARKAMPDVPDGAGIVKSPMVGTFYGSSEPGTKPFVEVGQRVAPDTVVCIIEVMKLMNSIAAGSAGVVLQVLVNDGEAVEFGQSLIVIDPNG